MVGRSLADVKKIIRSNIQTMMANHDGKPCLEHPLSSNEFHLIMTFTKLAALPLIESTTSAIPERPIGICVLT